MSVSAPLCRPQAVCTASSVQEHVAGWRSESETVAQYQQQHMFQSSLSGVPDTRAACCLSVPPQGERGKEGAGLMSWWERGGKGRRSDPDASQGGCARHIQSQTHLQHTRGWCISNVHTTPGPKDTCTASHVA